MDSLVKSVLGDFEKERISTIVIFRSLPFYYHKERSGKKPNTTRKIDDADKRFDALASGTAKYIKIINTETDESFVREIQDVSVYEGWMTISWRQERSEYHG